MEKSATDAANKGEVREVAQTYHCNVLQFSLSRDVEEKKEEDSDDENEGFCISADTLRNAPTCLAPEHPDSGIVVNETGATMTLEDAPSIHLPRLYRQRTITSIRTLLEILECIFLPKNLLSLVVSR